MTISKPLNFTPYLQRCVTVFVSGGEPETPVVVVVDVSVSQQQDPHYFTFVLLLDQILPEQIFGYSVEGENKKLNSPNLDLVITNIFRWVSSLARRHCIINRCEVLNVSCNYKLQDCLWHIKCRGSRTVRVGWLGSRPSSEDRSGSCYIWNIFFYQIDFIFIFADPF